MLSFDADQLLEGCWGIRASLSFMLSFDADQLLVGCWGIRASLSFMLSFDADQLCFIFKLSDQYAFLFSDDRLIKLITELIQSEKSVVKP